MPEVGIGFYPDVGGSYFLSHLQGELGTYLGVTGIQLRAADALHARLADWCLPSEQFEEFDRCLDNLNWTTPPTSRCVPCLAPWPATGLPALNCVLCNRP